MAFYLSPGVYTREIDLSTTIPAVATNIAVLAVRQPWKGSEFEMHHVANDAQLMDLLGFPTEKSYIDMLAGMGFLKYGRQLYISIARPQDATFSGIKVDAGYANSKSFVENFTYDAIGEVDSDEEDYPNEYKALGTTDLKEFPERAHGFEFDPIGDSDDVLWFISTWRGASANRIRVLTYDRDIFLAVRYHTGESGEYNEPTGITLSETAKTAVDGMFTENPTTFNYIKTSDLTIDNEYQFVVVVQTKEQTSDVWEEKEFFLVSTDETERNDSGQPLFVEDVINERSKYVRVALNNKYKKTNDNDTEPIAFGLLSFAELEGGHDGKWGRHAGVDQQVGENTAVIDAYWLYANPEEIDVNLFIDADKHTTVKKSLIELCQVVRKDCMVILDVPRNTVIHNKGSESTDIVKWRKGQDDLDFNQNTSYAALYANWLEVYDKWNKRYRWIPASGHVAGKFAHTDHVTDPWWAPAGLNRTVLTNVRRLAWSPYLGERDLLYKNGVNPIVSFSGQGKVIWGQKTLLDKSSAFNRINVRRLFLVLQKSISKAAKYFLFEQNDEVTWMLMTNMIEPFLRDVKGRRGVYDYKVQIDETTNTPVRIDRNELWGNIWIQPTRTAEFIVLNFIATPTGAVFDELIGAV